MKPFYLLTVLFIGATASYCESVLRIAVPDEASPVVQNAAQELADYLVRMGNAKPEVLTGSKDGNIFLGCYPSTVTEEEKRQTLKQIQGEPRNPDAFVLHSFGEQLVVDGNSPRAIEYGVYEYLESLGVRWYFPGRDNEVVPQHNPTLSGYDEVAIPTFRKRGVVTFTHRVIFENHPNNYEVPGLRDFVAFAAHKKLNTIAVHQSFSFDAARKIIEKYGLEAQQESHYFGEHYCPDDSAALEQSVERFEKYLVKAPASLRQFFLWPEDENLPGCPSRKYQDYTVSDLTLNFSNQMNRILQTKRPGAEFAFIAYLRTVAPPQHVKPDPGVILEWAPMLQSFDVALNDPSSPVNVQLKQQLEAYLRIFSPDKTQVLGYWLDDTLFSRSGLGNLAFRPEALQKELKYYNSLGIRDITSFGVFSMFDMFYSKTPGSVFIYPDLLWNVNRDLHAELREFCHQYYGDEGAYDVLLSIQKLDGIVYAEKDALKVDGSRMAEFTQVLAHATETAQSLMDRHRNDELHRSRLAKLLVEVASRANYRRLD